MHRHAPIELTNEQLECLRGCSHYLQYYKGRKAFEEGVCPFCQIDPIHTVLYDQDGWIAWEVPQNFTTRTSTLSLQLLFFPKRHIRRLVELTESEQLGFFTVDRWAHTRFDIPGGGIVMRHGDMRYNVGTIMHLHATNMVPILNAKEAVIVPFHKSSQMWEEHEKRMQGFAERYESGEVPEIG